jgi:uncharacterized membrane protein
MPSHWIQGAPTPQQLEEFRVDPRHWSRFGIYTCPLDPRLMVRGRLGLSWTLNMAHPKAQMVIWSVLAGTIILAGLLILFAE